MTDPLDGSAPSPGKADAVEASSAGPAAARVRLRWFLLACAVAAGAVLIDQGSKALALAQLSSARMTAIPLLGDWLGLQLAFNPGTVMSLGSDSTWLLTVIATAASIALLIAAARAMFRRPDRAGCGLPVRRRARPHAQRCRTLAGEARPG